MGKALAIVSLVTGILSLITGPLGIVLGGVALACGIPAMRRPDGGRGLAIAGVVTGGVGLLVGLGIVLLAYAGVLTPA